MDIKAIARNVKNKGLAETIRIAGANMRFDPACAVWKAKGKSRRKKVAGMLSSGREQEALEYMAAEFPPMIEKGIELLARSRSKIEKKEISGILKQQEDILKAKYPKIFKQYHDRMKEYCLTVEIPAIYAEESKKPVENKVIFMENGGSPSPTGYHLSKEIERQGKYKVSYRGLHIRKVADAEYYLNAKAYIKDLATAKAVFLSTANDLLSQFDLRPETKVIQLWHGVGMFKKVGYSTVDNRNFGKSAKDREKYNQYRNYTYVTVAGEEQIWTFEDAFRISRDTGLYKAIGIARTDVFFWDDYYDEQMEKLLEAFPQCRGKKLILYAPTFRGSVSKAKAPDRLDIRKMAEVLSDEYVLLIKHHGLCRTFPPIPKDLENVFAFDMNAAKTLTIEGLLAVADILITDYSSVGFEFAIREKPMVFFAYDIEDYMDKRGMYYDYEDITPGPVCMTTEEITDYIANIDERFDIEAVKAFRKKYVGACDGHSIERTIALLEE